jgi:hypothetical protein
MVIKTLCHCDKQHHACLVKLWQMLLWIDNALTQMFLLQNHTDALHEISYLYAQNVVYRV